MDLEIILSEVNQTEENKHHIILLIWAIFKKKKKTHKWAYLQNTNKPTNIENKPMVTKRERVGWRDKLVVWD